MRSLLIIVFSVMFLVRSKADDCVGVSKWDFDPAEVDVMLVDGFFIKSNEPNKNSFKLFVDPGDQLCAEVPANTLVKGEKEIRCKTQLRGTSAKIDFGGKSVVVCGDIDIAAVAEPKSKKVELNVSSARQGPDTYTLGEAVKAVDDKHGGNRVTEGCSVTTRGDNPWWEVDFVKPEWVTAVEIQDRTDGFNLRLKNFKVLVDGQLCIHYPGNFPDRETLQCSKPVYGITLRITKPDPDHLQLCDVVVYSNNGQAPHSKKVELNVSSARQSPGTYTLGEAVKAVDDKHGGNRVTEGCSVATRGPNPWWEVDFVKPAWVTAVEIQDRTDGFTNRLKNFKILVDGKQCAHYPGNFPNRETVKCDTPVFGKTLRITKPDSDHLQLCDVIVKTY